MGMYTELIFGARLKRQTPKEVIDTLNYMCGNTEVEPENYQWRKHRNPLRGGSYYFAVHERVTRFWHDEIAGWTLSSRANIKNYDGEIEAFLQWIKPFIEGGSGNRDFYAIVTYEEFCEPTIYYLHED